MSKYTIDDPEDGHFWRLMSEHETARFLHDNAKSEYGLTREEALYSGCRALAKCTKLPPESKKMLMGSCREFVLQWVSAKEGNCMLLKVLRKGLTDDEFEPLGAAGVAVLGESMVRCGKLVEIDAQVGNQKVIGATDPKVM